VILHAPNVEELFSSSSQLYTRALEGRENGFCLCSEDGDETRLDLHYPVKELPVRFDSPEDRIHALLPFPDFYLDAARHSPARITRIIVLMCADRASANDLGIGDEGRSQGNP
jgi:hypothetical protein